MVAEVGWNGFDLLVRGDFFCQPILTKHVAELLLLSLRVARTNSPSGNPAGLIPAVFRRS